MGQYTEIYITAPSQVSQGEVVDIVASVRNIHTGAISVTVTGSVNGVGLYFGSEMKLILQGDWRNWVDSFIMPGSNAELWCWSWYLGEDNLWHVDGEVSKNIQLLVVTASFSGLMASYAKA